MTRKDFQLIAATISTLKAYVSPQAHAEVADRFCMRLSEDNPRFDGDKFLIACGVN